MKEKVRSYAKKLNIDAFGVVSARPMEELREILIEKRARFGITPFEEEDIELRVNPKKTMEDAKSVLVFLFPYYNGEEGAQNVSKYARIPDYHKVVKEYLEKISNFIKGEKPDAKCLCFSDNGPLADKFFAYKAGLGFFGKNTLLISEKYGSFCFIGYIITNLLLSPDQPIEKNCGACKRCIDACPGVAIGEKGLCAEKCVSYITQAKHLTEEQKEILRSQSFVYGCDICQNVCPYNQKIPKTKLPEFSKPMLLDFQKETLDEMSNRAFLNEYGEFPFSWRGKSAIFKNFGR